MQSQQKNVSPYHTNYLGEFDPYSIVFGAIISKIKDCDLRVTPFRGNVGTLRNHINSQVLCEIAYARNHFIAANYIYNERSAQLPPKVLAGARQ